MHTQHSSLVPKDQALFFDAVADNVLTGRRDDFSIVAKVPTYLPFMHTYMGKMCPMPY